MRVAALLMITLVVACAETRPSPVSSPALDSGVTSSRGGADQALGNRPNVGVTTRTQ